MGILDIIILVLLVLSAIFGFIKGFGKSSLRRFAFLFALAAAYFIGIPCARGLMGTNIGGDWLLGLYRNVIPEGDIFEQSLAGLSYQAQSDLLSQALGEMNFPSFFRGFFISGAFDLHSDVGNALASSFSYYTLIAVFFLVFLIVFSLVLNLLFRLIAEPILGEDGKGIVGRILGLLKRVFYTSLQLLVLMAIVVFIDQLLLRSDIFALHDFLFEDLGLGTGEFSIGRVFYDTAYALLGWVSEIGG